MAYRAVLFDFDYTLGDATAGIVTSLNHAFSAMGFAPYSEEALRRTVGLSLPDTFSRLTGIDDPEKQREFVCHFKPVADRIMTGNTVLFPDTVRVLTELRRMGVRTGIVTTKYHYRIDEILEKFSIPHLIDVIIGGEDVENPKPHPDALYAAVKALALPRNEILYVGDSVVDAQAALCAGVDFAAVTTGTTRKEEFSAYPCVTVLRGIGELLELEIRL